MIDSLSWVACLHPKIRWRQCLASRMGVQCEYMVWEGLPYCERHTEKKSHVKIMDSSLTNTDGNRIRGLFAWAGGASKPIFNQLKCPHFPGPLDHMWPDAGYSVYRRNYASILPDLKSSQVPLFTPGTVIVSYSHAYNEIHETWEKISERLTHDELHRRYELSNDHFSEHAPNYVLEVALEGERSVYEDNIHLRAMAAMANSVGSASWLQSNAVIQQRALPGQPGEMLVLVASRDIYHGQEILIEYTTNDAFLDTPTQALQAYRIANDFLEDNLDLSTQEVILEVIHIL